MKRYISVLIFLFTLSFVAKGKASIDSINLQINHFTDSLIHKGVQQYLVYKITCSGECEFISDCKCKHTNIMKAAVFYKFKGKSFRQIFECCKVYVPGIIKDDFFPDISSLTKKLTNSEQSTGKHFLPPVATDQTTYQLLYYNSSRTWNFSFSENQVTNGSREQRAWSKSKKFQVQKEIFDYVKRNLNN